MYSKVVNVLASTGGGTQDITFTPNGSDPSWTPKIALFQWNRAVASTSAWIEHQCYGYGFTDGTNQRCACIVSEDNQADSDVASIASDTTLITTLTPTGTVETVDSTATFNSWLTNGIRINWSNAPAAQFYLTVMFLGGDDITNVTVGTITTPTGTGNFSITSLAYKPDFAMFLFSNVSSLDTPYQYAPLSLGAATSSSSQWCQAIHSADAAATMDTHQFYSHLDVVARGSSSVTGLVNFVSFNNDGFTLNASVAFSAAQPIFYLTMKGGYYSVGNNTEPGSTGNQTITTGIGTKAVGVFGLDTGTSDIFQTDLMWSGGFADNGINQFGHVFNDLNGAADSTVVSALDGAAHIYNNITANATSGSTTWDDSAIVNSMGVSGFVLNWDNVGNAMPFRYFAFGEAPPAEPAGLQSKVVTILSPSSSGNQSITFTADPSWTPKAAIVQWSRAAVSAAFNEG